MRYSAPWRRRCAHHAIAILYATFPTCYQTFYWCFWLFNGERWYDWWVFSLLSIVRVRALLHVHKKKILIDLIRDIVGKSPWRRPRSSPNPSPPSSSRPAPGMPSMWRNSSRRSVGFMPFHSKTWYLSEKRFKWNNCFDRLQRVPDRPMCG